MTESDPQRPTLVPSDAEWCADDNEWVLGRKNEADEYHGEVHYWRPDGTLVCIATLVDGKPDGECRRFHENGEVSQIANYELGELHGRRTWLACDDETTELLHSPGMSLLIRRVEVEYVQGRASQFHHFLADGVEVQRDGSPIELRPDGVPEHALCTKTGWVVGTWNNDGQRDGEIRHFAADGTPTSVENFETDVLHGPMTTFFPNGERRAVYDYTQGKLERLEFFYRGGELARRATLEHGTISGPLEDFEEDGTVCRSAVVEAPSASAEPASPTPPEIEFLASLGTDEPQQPPSVLSAAALASLLGLGWGGDEYREALPARRARSIIRGLGKPGLDAVLGQLGLDTAPRLITGARLDRLQSAAGALPSVDAGRLRAAFIAAGGVGEVAALEAGGAEAIAYLRNKVDAKQRLDLSHLGLRKLPPQIQHLSMLLELEASHNRLRSLPEEVGDLPLLRRIRLNGNAIEELPSGMSRLFDLRTLHLAENDLGVIPDTVLDLPALTTLNLADNELSQIPDEFAALEELRTLWLTRNPLQTLPSSFGRLSSLEFLHLGDVDWAEPPECLWDLEQLEDLWLASRALQRLPAEISRLKNLRTLQLWYSSLTELPETLFEMTHLKEIRIRENPDLPEETVARLREALPDCTIY